MDKDGITSTLVDLVEGRLEPEQWASWWAVHGADLLRLLNPGQALRFKFVTDPNRWSGLQHQAADVLKAWGVTASLSRNPSYHQLTFPERGADIVRDAGEEREQRNRAGDEGISRFDARFPAFAAFLRRHPGNLDGLGPPATEQELDELQRAIGRPLPPSLREFLRCARSLDLDEPVINLSINMMQLMEFHHNPERRRRKPDVLEMVLLCEFWLEADGDQLAFDHTRGESGECPIFYYSHAYPRVTRVADTFDELLSWWAAGNEKSWLETVRPKTGRTTRSGEHKGAGMGFALLKGQPVPLDLSKPYQVFCRDFDVEIEAGKLGGVEGVKFMTSEERLAKIGEDLAALRVRHDSAVKEIAARIRSANSQDALKDTVVTLLVDHSGSMRGPGMLLAANLVATASDLVDGLGTKQEVLGFTTVHWNGGRSREKWLQSGRPPYPGRLNDVLHLVYCSAGQRPLVRHYATMQRPGLLKENLDGEALAWAASRLRRRGESRKCLIVLSDGAPVDDSTLSENGAEYLENHLRSVIEEITQTGDVQLAAIGIDHGRSSNYNVNRYYKPSITVTPDNLGEAVLGLIEQLLCRPQTKA
jgi:cobaltochelatase CobT